MTRYKQNGIDVTELVKQRVELDRHFPVIEFDAKSTVFSNELNNDKELEALFNDKQDN